MAGPGFELRCVAHFTVPCFPSAEINSLKILDVVELPVNCLQAHFLRRSIASITELFESPRSQKEDSRPHDLSDVNIANLSSLL
jgi:hypothetical protein